MKRTYYIVLFFALFLVIVLSIVNLVFYLYVAKPISKAVTVQASDQGTLALTVEGVPSSPPAPSAGSSGGGGGGGGGESYGGATTQPLAFTVSPSEINLVLIAGETGERSFVISNKENIQRTVTIMVTGISDFVSFTNDRVVLKPKENKTIVVSFSAPLSGGVQAGTIIFDDGRVQRKVFVILNVQSDRSLFDVSLTIPSLYRIIRPGTTIGALISLTEVGEPTQVDATATYMIKDFNGSRLFSDTETFSVYRTKSFVKDFPTAKLPTGEYILGIEVSYRGGFASSSARFTVSEFKVDYDMIFIVLLALVSLIVIVYSIQHYYKQGKQRKKHDAC